jgi:hypothetical protein
MPHCKLPECPVAKDGRCLEGRAESCPNLIATSEAAQQEVLSPTAPEKGKPERAFEPLPGRAPLEIEEARYFSKRGRAVVIALAGMPDSGKTSLLARLHQLFQSGTLTGFDFAGSRSLPRFEELNWRATFESRVARPDMLHSSAQFDNSFLHLVVRPVGGGERVDILLNDIAGETFKTAIEVQSACEKLLALARADHLVALVDGEALADPDLRYLHLNQVCDFLQRVTQGAQCGCQTALHLVVSKLDRLNGNTAVVDNLEAAVFKQFHGKFGSLNFSRIAARPMDGSHPTNKAICELFSKWVTTTHRYPAPIIPSSDRAGWARDFCQYGV